MRYETFVNPRAVTHLEHDSAKFESPGPYHQRVPGYEPTPLLDAPQIAKKLGVKRVLIKDESHRLGMPSFKMLGASWAVAYAVRTRWLPDATGVLSPQELGELLTDKESKRLVAATDGNHGRGVARMAQMMGLRCLILVPAGTAADRITAIESEGAEVRVVDGTYDDSIAASADEADENNLVVSDTSWEGYQDIPRQVTQGYSTLFQEVEDAVTAADIGPPSAVLFQAGVGSFAAAGLIHFRGKGDEHAPRTVIVEPMTANCLYRSAEEGQLTEAPGPHRSTMAGLNCGLPSQLTWPMVQQGTDVFVGIDDESSDAAMRLLAENGIIAGESGAATLGALLAISGGDDEHARATVGLDADATVFMINTEYATDAENYARVVGETSEVVSAEADERRRSHGVRAL